MPPRSTSPTSTRGRRRLARWGTLAVGLASLAAGCDNRIPTSREEEAIARDRFISTMVELRVAAQRSPTGLATEAERDRILTEQGVTADELRQFVEVHGGNVPMMAEVWIEVERRIAETFGVAPVTEDGIDPEPDAGLP
jgi:hypothetical protein